MSGLINASGLITGLDSNTLIQQLLQLERGPILRAQNRITSLETQRGAVRDLRTQLLGLRNRAQDFRLNSTFSKFATTSSEEAILTSEISSSTPVVGAFDINVTQLASATVAGSSSVIGAAINPAANLNSSGIASEIVGGTFTINGVQLTVDPAAQSLSGLLSAINSSGAGVTATYNAGTDTVTVENSTGGDTSLINFGASGDESNILSILGLTQATQSTGGGGSTTATSTRHLAAINPSTELSSGSYAGGAVTAGVFSINGISISIDPSADSILDVLERINSSDAQVTASYDTSTDTVRVVAKTLGSRTVNFGGAGDTSNFLAVTNLSAATQTAGNDAQFTVNGGAVLTRNTNSVSDAIGGVTLNLRSTGASTVTVASDDDAIVEDVQAFIDEFNGAVSSLRELTATGGTLQGDAGIRSIEDFLRTNIFNNVAGISGTYTSLISIGITTGQDFDSSTPPTLELDEDTFREALRTKRSNVEALFSNASKNGVADVLFEFLDEGTKATGFLNERAKANGFIDQQIRSLNDQIDRNEVRLAQKEGRLRRQFTRLEQLSSGFQNQNSALAGLSSGFRLF